MKSSLHEQLIEEGYKLAYSFTPRHYKCDVKIDGKDVPVSKDGDAQHILGLVGQGCDNGKTTSIKLIKLVDSLRPGEKADHSVEDRVLVYIK